MDFINRLATEFKLRPQQVQAAVELLDAGNTIPFIARYRKEATGSLDDQVLREMAERLEYLRNLEKRREEIAASLEEQGVMNDELQAQLAKAATLSELEAVGRASILIPYPAAAENHQYYNAKSFSDVNACILLQEKDFNESKVASLVENLIYSIIKFSILEL